jgi:hypothetical protein
VPLSFAPGEAYQFDWSHEVVLINGTTVTVKVAHCPAEPQPDAVRAGLSARDPGDGVRRAQPCLRFLQGHLHAWHLRQHEDGGRDSVPRQGPPVQPPLPAGHYLVEPVACTPASGWEKGQVENQVGVVRERFFTLRLRVASYDELNAWLLDRCVAYAKAHRHPELTDLTVWQVFEAERSQLVPIRGPFDGFHATQAAVSKTCLVRFDNNKYSVTSRAVGRPVEIQAYADRLVIRQDGAIVGEHPRCFGRGATIYDPWHYVPVLARKPGALCNGAPFKDWPLPANLALVRHKLKSSDDGDRQMVKVLSAVLTDGLAAVETACAEALAGGVHSADVVLNILARHRDPGPAATILTPDALRLRHASLADCARYDRLRRAS